MIKLFNGNNIDLLKKLEDNSVDSIVTDPPYGLKFMGKKWDHDVPSTELWEECLRVLKPGGYLLAFAGTRTQHRMAVRIEDSGFEIRDMIAWVYGSGFPKSLDVSKALDKTARGERVVALICALLEMGHTISDLGEKTGIPSLASSFRDWTVGGHRPEEKSWERLLTGLGLSEDDGLNIISRRTVKIGNGTTYTFRQGASRDYEIKDIAPSSPEAIRWAGWGTALKPALEPITVARKPFKGTVTDNVLKYGTGAINIDGCRVGNEGGGGNGLGSHFGNLGATISNIKHNQDNRGTMGRWPANFIHDGSEEVIEVFGNSSRFFYCAKASKRDRDEGLEGFPVKGKVFNGQSDQAAGCAAGSVEKKFSTQPAANFHPTVKPTDLMRYLVRLVTPKGGIVLDPFMGSGSTGKACVLEGFNFIGMELDKDYFNITEARINNVKLKQE